MQQQATFRILLVEDEPIVQIVHRRMLEKLGYAHDLVTNGQEALSSFDKHYDLILMDIGLPDLSGIEVTQLIRAREKSMPHEQCVPIVGLTAFGEDNIQERCMAAGMNEVTIKPISEEVLQEIVNRCLKIGVREIESA